MPCKIVKQHYSVNGASSGLSSVHQCESTSELLWLLLTTCFIIMM